MLKYVTIRQPPIYHQMSLEELLFGSTSRATFIRGNETNTRTYTVESVSERLKEKLDIRHLIGALQRFNESNRPLLEADRAALYHSFSIPKKAGGLRKIDAPNPELMTALRQLKQLFEVKFHTLYHTSAFAYIKGRCTLDAVKRHQANESRWFAKLDLHDFFGSTNKEFLMQMLSMIYPFSEVVEDEAGREALSTALELAFLRGGLPQGTPISPLLTNIMMIPVDHCLYNTLRSFNGKSFVYTRYADDFLISSRYDFDIKEIERLVVDVLKKFRAPFSINEKKTRYGSSSGSNWNLGVMLNKDNQITIGHKRKKQFQTMVFNYLMDRKNGRRWDISDLQEMQGLRSYYHMVEPGIIDSIIRHMNEKCGADFDASLKADLSCA